jgi:FlgD Ig-like domain
LRSVAVTLLVLGLLGGSAAAFAVTEALKLERSPITAPRFTRIFSPVCSCEQQTAVLTFRLRRSDRLDAVVVDDDADPVQTLLLGQRHRRGRVSLTWDGRDDAGRIVADGRYSLRLHLAREHRTILMPNRIFVDTTRPTIRILGVAPPVFSPDGDGSRDELRISYVASEAAQTVVLVDGTVAGEGGLHRQGKAVVTWDGTVGGETVPAGSHAITLRARDRAGNLSHQSAPVEVRVRFVEVAPASLVVQRGGHLRFRISADARTVSWRLVRAGRTVLAGSAPPGVVTADLPIRIRAGRYTLRVGETGHVARATVRVVGRRG